MRQDSSELRDTKLAKLRWEKRQLQEQYGEQHVADDTDSGRA